MVAQYVAKRKMTIAAIWTYRDETTRVNANTALPLLHHQGTPSREPEEQDDDEENPDVKAVGDSGVAQVLPGGVRSGSARVDLPNCERKSNTNDYDIVPSESTDFGSEA